ncbi:MAG: hydantoinase/oxoprolinase family protein [Gemmatimonadota bacterium]
MSGSRPIIGIDTGGTFTDFVLVEGGEVRVHKLSSTPDNPARAVRQGLAELVGGVEGAPTPSVPDIVHGSTVATNALLERRGARVTLITTAGFEDVLEIGRQARPAIYDLEVSRAPCLVPAERRLGVSERVGPDGEVLEPLRPGEVERILRRLAPGVDSGEARSAVSDSAAVPPEGEAAGDAGFEAVAICLLHSYADSVHERALAAEIRASRPDLFVTASHEVLPEFREYERASTTAANAYVGPVVARYLSELEAALGGARVRIMQSNGGVLSLGAARRLAVQTILSGPAGGVVGGFEIARRAGFENAITFDMGGTSTDVSLCAGGPTRTAEAVIGEVPIRLPVLDIHTVGAGGGSVAYQDPGGSLRVGPRSAGAVPGPICYGRGGAEPTVTDANLFLGRLPAEHFLGGEQRLVVEPVRQAMEAFASELGLTARDAAEGILRVANATMERAIRVISLERGHDPRDFTLVCFGGAGGLHAADLARALGIPRVLVPRSAGVLSALGMLLADVVRDFSQTLLASCAGLKEDRLEGAFGRLEARGRAAFEPEGFAAGELRMDRSLDMRYVGQGYELTIPYGGDFVDAFHRRHQERYGYHDPQRAVEIVNVRLRVTGGTPKPALAAGGTGGTDVFGAILGTRPVVFGGSETDAILVDRERLEPGHAFAGPAVVVEYSTTTVVPPDARCVVDGWGNLRLEWTEPA